MESVVSLVEILAIWAESLVTAAVCFSSLALDCSRNLTNKEARSSLGDGAAAVRQNITLLHGLLLTNREDLK